MTMLLIGLDIAWSRMVSVCSYNLCGCTENHLALYSCTITRETRAWHYPPEEKLEDDELDEEDLKVHFSSFD